MTARPRARVGGQASARAGAEARAGDGQGTWHSGRATTASGTRSYLVYVPPRLPARTPAPLVMALHGCSQNARDFAHGTRFNQLADRHGFVVVYPEQGSAHHGQRCWNWFRATHQHRGQGEPAILAGVVHQTLAERDRWHIDPTRVYAAGISAGAAMTLVLGATYPELFAALGVHSSPPYRSATGPGNALAAMGGAGLPSPAVSPGGAAMPPLIVFQGTADGTVRSSNADRVADQWLAFRRRNADGSVDEHGIRGPRVVRTGPQGRSDRGPRRRTVSRWYAGGRKVLEVWVVDGLGHAWSGGSTRGSYTDPRGPRAATEMWRFFAAHTAVHAGAHELHRQA